MPLIAKALGISMFMAWSLTIASLAIAAPTKQECVDANERGQALRQHENLRTARAELAMCVSASCPDPVSEDCATRISEIDRAMPTLLFDLRDEAGHEVTNVSLRVDDTLVAARIDGSSAIAIDPGTHEIVLTPPGGAPRREVLVVREGEKDRRVNVVLDVVTAVDASHTQRVAGLALAGVGALGAVVGGILGIVAKSTYDAALTDNCGGAARTCNAAGASEVNAAHGQAAAATGGVVAGAALLVGGVALWATARTKVQVTGTVGAATLGLSGSF